MKSLENQNITRRKGKMSGFGAGVYCGLITLISFGGASIAKNLMYTNQKIKEELYRFVEILDEDNDKKPLSEKEVQRFYDVTGFNPSEVPFESLTREQWNSFLNNYKR